MKDLHLAGMNDSPRRLSPRLDWAEAVYLHLPPMRCGTPPGSDIARRRNAETKTQRSCSIFRLCALAPSCYLVLFSGPVLAAIAQAFPRSPG